MSERRTFIITRPASDSARFMEAVRKAGHAVLSSPLLSIRFREDADMPDRDWQAVAVTSANGARAIARHPMRERIVRAKAVTVGPASTKAARAAGFSDILQAQGDVEAVIRLIRERLDPDAGPILYASGAVTRGDLEGELSTSGFEVLRAVLYEAVKVPLLSGEVRDFLASGRRGTVALYSPRSAKIWAALAREAGLEAEAARQDYGCLSRNVERSLRGELAVSGRVTVPQRPDEAAFLEALGLA